jgi:hypothetical protein
MSESQHYAKYIGYKSGEFRPTQPSVQCSGPFIPQNIAQILPQETILLVAEFTIHGNATHFFQQLLPEREPKQAWSAFRVQYLRPAGRNFKVTKTCP